MMRALGIALLLLLAEGAATARTGSTPSSDAAARAAVALLERSAAALAGEPDEPVRAVEWETNGRHFWPNQGPSPSVPTEFALRQRQFVELGGGRAYFAFDYDGAESSFERSGVYDADAGDDFLQVISTSPLAVVRAMLSRPADLRVLGRSGGSAVVAGPLAGRIVEIEIAADGLPRALSHAFDDELHGDSVRRFEYADYRARDGGTAPRRIRQLEAGRLVLDTELVAFAAGGDRPGWSDGIEPRERQAPSASAAFEAVPLAPRVHLLQRYGGSDYHGMAVELDEGWMVLETPWPIGDGSALRRTLAAISGKPIVYAAATHHHGDHSAGMAAVAQHGATILATPGNVEFFRTMVAAPRTFAPFEGSAVARVRALAPGERIGPVQFFDVGPTPHAAEHLVFYFPEHRLLFHSDMGRFNPDGSVEPGRPQTCALLAFIERRGLAVDRIVSGHGRPGTLDDLRQAVAMEGSACAR